MLTNFLEQPSNHRRRNHLRPSVTHSLSQSVSQSVYALLAKMIKAKTPGAQNITLDSSRSSNRDTLDSVMKGGREEVKCCPEVHKVQIHRLVN